MKKLRVFAVAVVLSLSLGVVAMATWFPLDKVVFSGSTNASVSWTNLTATPVRVSSVQTKYISAATGNVVYGITHSGQTNIVLKTSALSSATDHFVGESEFAGAYLYSGDILTITNGCVVTNTTIVTLEGTR